MSELLHDGPLDIVRNIENEAIIFDNNLPRGDKLEADDLAAGMVAVQALSRDHPYFGLKVKIYGQPLTFGLVDEEVQRPLVAATDHEYTVPRGLYMGMTVRPVYYPDLDYQVATVVHTLASEDKETHTYYDEDWNFREEAYTLMTYVPIARSEVVPEITYNMHSFKELAGDPALAKIKQLISATEADDHIFRPGIIRGIGGIANSYMRRNEFADPLHRQRVSYLNSLGIFEHVAITADDFVLVEHDDFDADIHEDAILSTHSQSVTFQPVRLEIASGYDRFSNDLVLPGGSPEVYAVTDVTTYEGNPKAMFVPLKLVSRTSLVGT